MDLHMWLVMQSPEKLEARLKELHSAVDRERSLIAKAERQSRELQGKLDVISKVQHSVLGKVYTSISSLQQSRSSSPADRSGRL